MAKFAPSAQPDLRAPPAEATPLRPRDTIGLLLRRTRQEHGGDLEAIAATLRIRAAYLDAIEQGRSDRLPGAVYAIGFVRSYAAYLGLDPEEAVRRFKLESSGLEQRRDLSFPMPLTQRSIPGGRVLLLALVLAVCAYFFWQYLSTEEMNRTERVAAVPSDLMPPPPPAPAQSAAPAPAQAAAPAASAPPAPAPAPAAPVSDQTAVAAPLPAPVTATQLAPPGQVSTLVAPPPPPLPNTDLGVTAATPPAPPPAAVEPAPAPVAALAPPPAVATPSPAAAPAVTEAAAAPPHVFGAVDGPSRITLRATKDCWILVRDSDPAQTVVTQRTLHAGDSYRVPDRKGLTLRTGNATGLQIVVDDKPAPALAGTVRNFALDPDRLLAGAAPAQ